MRNNDGLKIAVSPPFAFAFTCGVDGCCALRHALHKTQSLLSVTLALISHPISPCFGGRGCSLFELAFRIMTFPPQMMKGYAADQFIFKVGWRMSATWGTYVVLFLVVDSGYLEYRSTRHVQAWLLPSLIKHSSAKVRPFNNGFHILQYTPKGVCCFFCCSHLLNQVTTHNN